MTAFLVRCAVYTRKSSEEGLERSFNSLPHNAKPAAYILSQRRIPARQVLVAGEHPVRQPMLLVQLRQHLVNALPVGFRARDHRPHW